MMDYWNTRILFFLSILIVSVYAQEFFNTMPPPVNTNFTCKGRDTGFYADMETNCRVYHTCDDYGNKFTYYCPEETAFRQEALVCDHAHLVDCAKGRRITKYKSVEDKNKEDNQEGMSNDRMGFNSNRKSSNVESTFGEAKNTDGRSIDVFQPGNSNLAYTRSFRITSEPPSQFPTPKSLNRKQPTFVLSSSVFLRNRGGNFQKNSPVAQGNRVVTESSKILSSSSDSQFQFFNKKEEKDQTFSTSFPSASSVATFRPFGMDLKQNSQSSTEFQFRNMEKKEENSEGFFGRFSSTTTFRPFGAGAKVKDDLDDVPSFGKVRFDYDSNERNAGSRMQFDNEQINTKMSENPPKFNDKRTNNDKIHFSGNRETQERNSGKRNGFEAENQGRNNGGFDDFPKDFSGSRNAQGFSKDSQRMKPPGNAQSSFLLENSNFPYSETLRSMQARTENSGKPNTSTMKPNYSNFASTTTPSPIRTAGTEFPVFSFTGSLAPLIPNELDDDPYYPKRSTTTEIYYKVNDRDGEGYKPFRFSTRRPWPGSIDFEIPDVLPDLNTLDDLVDRRKYFYIPRVKTT